MAPCVSRWAGRAPVRHRRTRLVLPPPSVPRPTRRSTHPRPPPSTRLRTRRRSPRLRPTIPDAAGADRGVGCFGDRGDPAAIARAVVRQSQCGRDIEQPAAGAAAGGTCRCWRSRRRWSLASVAKMFRPQPRHPACFWSCRWQPARFRPRSGSEDHIRAEPSSPSGGSDQRERGGRQALAIVFSRRILACSCRMPYSSASAVGGQPGT